MNSKGEEILQAAVATVRESGKVNYAELLKSLRESQPAEVGADVPVEAATQGLLETLQSEPTGWDSGPYPSAAETANLTGRGLELSLAPASSPEQLKELGDPGKISFWLTKCLEAASTLAEFDVKALVEGVAPKEYSSILAPLVVGYTEPQFDPRNGSVVHVLKESVRRTHLANLLQHDELRGTLQQRPPGNGSVLQQALELLLTGRPFNAKRVPADFSVALVQARRWLLGLEGYLPQLPPLSVLQDAREMSGMLHSFRRLTGRWEGLEFHEHFRGRATELARLRGFVDVVEAQSFSEAAGRGISGVAQKMLNFAVPPLATYGPGGVGKSTLLAKFLLDHLEAQSLSHFPFAYLDFDRPDLNPREPATLVGEIARQLAIQYAGSTAGDSLGRIAAEVAQVGVRRGWRELGLDEKQQVEDDVLDQLIADMSEVDPGRPFLLVLDTFEEVQYTSEDAAEFVLEAVMRLQNAMPRMRTVIAGRSEPDPTGALGMAYEGIALDELDGPSAKAFLMNRGVPSEEAAQQVVDVVGCQPLALVLAAQLLREHGLNEVVAAAGSPRSAPAMIRRMLAGWRKDQIPGRLYQRILDHIRNREVQKIASPGLVLRRVTPSIIEQVLAGPCDLQQPVNGKDLFRELAREVSLVSPDEEEVLRHRTDLRRLMLPLVLADSPQKAEEIQRRAVDYLATRDDPGSVAEWMYHRLMLGDSPRKVESRWSVDVGQRIRSGIDELPPRAQAFVAARLEIVRPPEVWNAAEPEDFTLYATRRGRDLLHHNRPGEALSLLADPRIVSDLRAEVLAAVARLRIEPTPEDLAEAEAILERTDAPREDRSLLAKEVDRIKSTL